MPLINVSDHEALKLIADQIRRPNGDWPLQEDGSFMFKLPYAQIVRLRDAGFVKLKSQLAFHITSCRITMKGWRAAHRAQ